MRAQYDLPEAPCIDCLVHFCFKTCALCQEYRELKNHGFDLTIGNSIFTLLLTNILYISSSLGSLLS